MFDNLPDVPPSVDNAVKNLTDHPTSNIGQTLGDIWFLVFGGISHAADKKRLQYAHDLDQFRAELDSSISAIPPEKLIEPDFQTVALAFESSKYCVTSEELRTMFTNLISGSMNKDYEPKIHPSFPEIIKQMSSDDAKLLSIMKANPLLPTMTLGEMTDDHGYHPIAPDVLLDYPGLPSDHATLSAASLEHAGLATIYRGGLVFVSNDDAYIPFEKLSVYESVSQHCEESGKSLYKGKGSCELTNFGRNLIDVCVR